MYHFSVVDANYEMAIRVTFTWRMQKLNLSSATHINRRNARLLGLNGTRLVDNEAFFTECITIVEIKNVTITIKLLARRKR